MRIGGRLPTPPQRSLPKNDKRRGLGLLQSFLLTALLSFLLVLFLLYRQRTWTLRGQRALVVVHDQQEGVRKKLTLLVVDPLQSDLRIIPLPPQQYILTALPRYGAYQTDALAGFTQLENLDWQFLEQSLAREYGIVFDGVIWSDKAEIRSLSDAQGVAWQGVLNQIDTTLSYWDRWTWWRMVSAIPVYQAEVAPLQDWIDDQGRLRETQYEAWAETKIQDEQVRQSGVSIVVQNGTEVQGEANRVARMLRIMGFSVRSIDTVEKKESTKIVLSEGRAGNTDLAWAHQRLQDMYPQAEVVYDDSITQRARADVVVILGQDQEKGFILRRH